MDENSKRPVVVVDTLLTIEELAAYLHVPVATSYAWRHKGIGPRALRIGKHLRYRPADVHSWLEDR